MKNIYTNGNITVHPIPSKDAHEMILTKHYAQRLPPISWAFGLFLNNKLTGICTFGKPASRSLCIGICGKEYHDKVYELNRLITLDDVPKNALSYFVSKCLKMLKQEDLIIVSYADDGFGHKGYIYQATNFIYTGKSKERTDKYMPGNKHSRHYTDEYSHLRKYRTAKHRYIYFTGKSKNIYLKALNYIQQPYPKGDNTNYKLGDRYQTKIFNSETGETFYE